MNRRQKLTINTILHIAITIMMALTFFVKITGLVYHEIAGIILCVLFILHGLMFLPWMKAIITRWKTTSVKNKRKMIVIILLIVVSTICLITGILISEVILLNITKSGDLHQTHRIHHLTAIVAGVLCLVHILLHWKPFINNIKKTFKPTNKVN